jgi:hypothetical protein
MKLKNLSLLIFVLSLVIISCSNDDDNNSTQINLQDLEVTIDENPTNGDIVGTVQSNSTSPLTFSIVSQTPVGALAIDATSGELTVLDTGLFDFETNSTITAIISSSEAVNTATVTINLNNINEIGDYNHGGVVFWIDPTDDSKGLVCAINDQTSGVRWDNPTGPVTTAPGTSNNLGTGLSNTNTIIAHEGGDQTTYAAGIARAYNGGGFTDWFLPSVDEVAEMNTNKTIINTVSSNNGGTILPDQLWTSSKIDSSNESVYLYNLVLGGPNGVLPINSRRVRAVRAFE